LGGTKTVEGFVFALIKQCFSYKQGNSPALAAPWSAATSSQLFGKTAVKTRGESVNLKNPGFFWARCTEVVAVSFGSVCRRGCLDSVATDRDGMSFASDQ
jgi:hypothetical protein